MGRRDLLERLANGEILITYGPMHTLLEEETGRNLDGHLAEWIVDHPNEFQTVLRGMYAAGCDIGMAGTQGNIRYRLREFPGLEDRLYEMTLKQVQLAREVTPEHCYLAGLLGCTGTFLKPVGDVTPDELYDAYKEVITPMIDGGVDLLIFAENDTEEIAIAIKVTKDLCDLPVIGQSMLYATKTGIRTLMGVPAKTASARLEEAGADIIGASCGAIANPISDALTAVKEMRQGCSKPVSVRPDAGLAQLIDGKIVQPLTPQDMANEVPKWIAAGASLVGGCCGNSLKHIRAITEAAKGKK